MAEMLDFSAYAEEPNLDVMGPEQLRDYLDTVLARIGALDEQEPEDMESEAYEEWGSRHEELEDLLDEIRDRLDD